jgi:hypothetical protein
MNEFLKLEADAPETLGAVVEAVTRLSTTPSRTRRTTKEAYSEG